MSVTTNMGLILPDVSTTVGPTYATNNNTAFTAIDSHDHTSGNGVLIPTAGLSMNGTLQFNDNAITELTRSNFTSQASALTGTNHLQVISNELHFVDGSGNNVKITNGGALDITSTGGFGGDYTSAGASATYTDATNNYLFRNGSSVESELSFTDMINSGKQEWMTHNPAGDYVITDTDARMVILADTSAARSITLPDPTLGRRVVVIVDDTGTANDNNITITRNGSEKINNVASDFVMSTNNGSITLISDLTDWWIVSSKLEVENVVAVYDGTSTSTSSENITTTFSSLTINTTSLDKGTDPIVRTNNVLAFGKATDYIVTVELPMINSASPDEVMARLRNTTTGTTLGKSVAMETVGGSTGLYGPTFHFPVTITSTSDNHEIQVACQAITQSVNTFSAIDSETYPLFRYMVQEV